MNDEHHDSGVCRSHILLRRALQHSLVPRGTFYWLGCDLLAALTICSHLNITDFCFLCFQEAENVHIFALDVCFTQLIVVSLNVLVWRGMWNILDAFLFPENHLKSDLASLIIGYSIMIVLFLLQYPMSLLSAKLDNKNRCVKIAYEDVIIALATWGVLNVWRAEWDFLKKYFLPDPFVGGWVCHWIGTVGLMALQGFANVGTNGIDIDGSYKNGEALFPTEFLRPLVIDRYHAKKEKVSLWQW